MQHLPRPTPAQGLGAGLFGGSALARALLRRAAMSGPTFRLFPRPREPERPGPPSGLRLRADAALADENDVRPMVVEVPPPPRVPSELAQEAERREAGRQALDHARQLLSLDRPQAAVRYLMRATAMDPENPAAHAELGWALFLSGPASPVRGRQAGRALRRALELGGPRPHADHCYYFAQVLEALGKREPASTYLHAAARLGNAAAAKHLAERRTRRWWRR